MSGASFQFLGFALFVIIIFNLRASSIRWRQAVLLIASTGFLSFFAQRPLVWFPLLGFLLFGFAAVRIMQAGRERVSFIPLLVTGMVAFFWLKKYTFVPQVLFLQFPYLTLGLSYIFFRVLHLIIDAKNGDISEKVGFVSYLNYTLNFTTLVSGPIQRYQEFSAFQLAPTPLPLSVRISGQAIERVIAGFFKVNVLSLVFSTLQSQALAALPAKHNAAGTISSGVLIYAAYPLYLYCNFSGYIDMVIGIARFLRIELPENFRRPFSSDNFINFWSRWHITLSEWLKTYVYNPLLIGLMRKNPAAAAEPFFGVLAFFVTFFLIGVWHGQTSEFIFFGLLQGFGVSAVKLYQILMAKWLGRKRYKTIASGVIYTALGRGLTFTWFTFTLIWFWSNWTEIGRLVRELGIGSLLAVWLAIFLSSTVLLEGWERLRSWCLSVEWQEEPLLLSRYVRTVWNTALAVVATSVVVLMSGPAPDIVYKAF